MVVCCAAATFVPIVAASSRRSPAALPSIDPTPTQLAVQVDNGISSGTEASVATVGGRSLLLPTTGTQGTLVDDASLVPGTDFGVSSPATPATAEHNASLEQDEPDRRRTTANDDIAVHSLPPQNDDVVLLSAREVYNSRPFFQLMASAILFGGAFSGILPHVPIFIAEQVGGDSS